ncbi:ATP-dependent Clp protease proteolytic subunit [Planctomycetes bacterium FF15]|uniref:ATP-dependent Clp protease proteolytic subunit n=2 Tax=Bremerella alba TaxID=980252 RepID=A0A7V9A9R9_9BACT|nr:ATP-dependent Clp protease proteolytic subunit [Bremerella alba]
MLLLEPLDSTNFFSQVNNFRLIAISESTKTSQPPRLSVFYGCLPPATGDNSRILLVVCFAGSDRAGRWTNPVPRRPCRHVVMEGSTTMNSQFPNAPVGPMAMAYADYQRQRQMTLGDLLLENRIVFLQGEIYDGNANELVMKLLYLQSENRRKQVHFYINSPGGSVTSTMAIYDTMQMLSCPVATYCVGLAASGGAILLAGGAAGKRFILPHAKVMIHQPHGGVGGQVSDIEIQANEIIKTREELNKILAAHCDQPEEKIAKDVSRDFYMNATEAKEYRIVDEILTKPPEEAGEED